MNKKICNIVLDLLPIYVEDDVTNDTKEFIEEHIKECSNCKNKLDIMKMDIVKEEDKLKNDTKIEVEKIKKVNKKLQMHKGILQVSSIIISIIAIIFLGCTIYKEFNKTLYDNIQEIYDENMKLDNYHLTQKNIYKNYFETGSFEISNDIYCKDSKFKIYENFKSMNADKTEKVRYGEIGSDKITEIDINDNSIKEIHINDENSTDVIKHSSYVDNKYILDDIGYHASLDDFKNIDYKDMEIKFFEEREWYVYREGNEINYNEYWIDKNNLTDIRLIESNEKFYRETSFVFERNVVTEEKLNINYDTTNFKRIELYD